MPQVRCKICNKEFYIKPNHLKRGWGKYCSRECQHEGARRGKFVRCAVCGKQTWKAPRALKHSKSGNFFCSKSCQTVWRNQYFSGRRHPNWRGGEYVRCKDILIQSGVNPVCKVCGTKDERVLIVHHKDRNHKNHSIKNLVWLCLNCHHLVHHYNRCVR